MAVRSQHVRQSESTRLVEINGMKLTIHNGNFTTNSHVRGVVAKLKRGTIAIEPNTTMITVHGGIFNPVTVEQA